MKKSIVIGIIFGILIVPLSLLGLGFFWAEALFVPFTIISRWFTLMILQNAGELNGMITLGLATTISAIWYGLLGWALGFIYKQTTWWLAGLIFLLYYFLFAFFGVSSVTYAPATSEKFISPREIAIEDCAKLAGAGIQSSLCLFEGGGFEEATGNQNEKKEVIMLDAPVPNQTISSPLEISGQARGTWFFEGDFPVELYSWDGILLAQGVATAQSEWMTENFIPFKATLEFSNISNYKRGALILKKNNPSGLEENDDSLEVLVNFE